MSATFWSNTIWYILLFITSIVSISVTFYKSPNRKLTTAFTISVIGFTYVIEVFLLLIFNAYSYYPKLVTDQFLDDVLGNIFSQVSISSTAVLISVYDLPNTMIFVFAVIYYFIEELFIELGIFAHNWYKTVYTVIGFIPFCWLIKKWYRNMLVCPKKLVYYITFFLGTFAIYANSIITVLRLCNIQMFRGSFFNDPSRNHTSVGVIYGFSMIVILIILYKCKLHWALKGIVFLCLFICQYALFNAGVIHIKQGWFFIVTLLDLLGCYFWVAIIDFLLSKEN